MENKKTLPTQSSSSKSIDQNQRGNINQLTTEHQKRKFFISKFFFLLYHLARVTFCIATIILIGDTNLDNLYSSQTYERFQQTIKLWEKDVIIDIKAINSYNCPEGYQPMIGYGWPGISEGCACKGSSIDYQLYFVMKGQCSQRAIQYECLRVNATQKVAFSFWIDHTKLLCIKRLPNLDFFSVDSNQFKSRLTKVCGQNKQYEFSIVDDTQILTSMERDQIKCPITEIFSTDTQTHGQVGQIISGQDINYTQLDKFLMINRQNSYPIADFQISQYKFCPTYTKKNISPNRTKNYPLQIESRTYCQEVQTLGSDPRIIQFDSQTEQSFFSRNPRVLEIIEKLPGYPTPSSDFVYKLGFVRYPAWTHECRISTQYNLYRVKEHVQLEDDLVRVTINRFLVILFSVFYGFLLSFIFCARQIWELRIRYQAGYLYTSDQQTRREKPNLLPQKNCQCQLVFFIIEIILALALIITLTVYIAWVNSEANWFKQSIKCLGEQQSQRFSFQERNALAKWIEHYRSSVSELLKSILLSLVFIFIVFVTDFGSFLFRITIGDLHGKTLKVNVDGQNEELQVSVQDENNTDMNDQGEKTNKPKRKRDTLGVMNQTQQNFLAKDLDLVTFSNGQNQDSQMTIRDFDNFNLNGFPRKTKIIRDLPGIDSQEL